GRLWVCWRRWGRLVPTYAADGGDAKMQPGTGQHLRDLDLAQAGTKRLETLNRVANEIGELIHWHRHLHERRWAFFVQPVGPGRDGRLRNLEHPRRLRQGQIQTCLNSARTSTEI